MTKFHHVKELFRSSGADNLIPCAGPPCFLNDEHFELNFSDESIFPTQAMFYEFLKMEGLAAKTFILMPGDTFDPTQDCKIISEKNVKREEFTDRRKYLESYRTRRKDILNKIPSSLALPFGSLFEKCKEYFEPLVESSLYFRKKINGRLLLDITGRIHEKIIVDFTKEKNQVKLFENEHYFYKLEIDSRIFNLILEKKLTWEQLLLSLRFKASRNPDMYNEALIVFLRFADANSYEAFELYETRRDFSDTFLLEHGGQKYEVQRYCPHAMGDLSKGRIIDGHIVCPNHGWTFSIEDGKCLAKNSAIRIKKVN
jgi:UDP-MurNAc hydroxylase